MLKRENEGDTHGIWVEYDGNGKPAVKRNKNGKPIVDEDGKPIEKQYVWEEDDGTVYVYENVGTKEDPKWNLVRVKTKEGVIRPPTQQEKDSHPKQSLDTY